MGTMVKNPEFFLVVSNHGKHPVLTLISSLKGLTQEGESSSAGACSAWPGSNELLPPVTNACRFHCYTLHPSHVDYLNFCEIIT